MFKGDNKNNQQRRFGVLLTLNYDVCWKDKRPTSSDVTLTSSLSTLINKFKVRKSL